MRRARVTIILYFILIFTLLILSLKLDNNSMVLLLLLLLTMGGFTFKRIEAMKLAESVGYYFSNKDYEKLIEYLKEHSESSIVYSNCVSCVTTLSMVYMMNNNIAEVKELINKNQFLKRSRNTCYINLILALDDNNLELAKEYNSKLQTFKNARYIPQKEAAELLIHIVETQTYDESIESKTQYQLVIDIAKRYQKDN